MNTKIQDLSLEELKAFIGEAVDTRLEEGLGDPDVGFEVKPELIKKIRKSRKSKVTIPAEKVAQHLGLDW